MKNHLLLAALALFPGVGLAQSPGADAEQTLFRDSVRPLLSSKCVGCHNATKAKGGLDLSRRQNALKGGDTGPSLVPGDSAKSLLLRRVADHEMPPSNPLTEEQSALLKKWIDAGAFYEKEPILPAINRAGADWWSLQKPRSPVPPTVREKSKVQNAIDAFLLARLEATGLTYAPAADRLTLLRRATFDLTGLPPTPEEIEQFLADTSPHAYEKLIDRLLDSPRYGERWGRHWLDIVRFAESHGYETNQLRPNAWPYRDYVIRAFNQDLSYPQFILEQLAGDTLKDADFLTQSATGFLVGGAHDVVGNQTVEGALQQRMDDLDDIVTATGATFLGLTINCARCHDHKFDPISQKDYYALQAIFAGVQHSERTIQPPDLAQRRAKAADLRAQIQRLDRDLEAYEPLADPAAHKPMRAAVSSKRNVERFAPVEARMVRFVVLATNNGIEPCIDELEIYTTEATPRNVALASAGAKPSASSVYPSNVYHKVEHINDGRHGNSFSWISREAGKGWVQIDFPTVHKIDRIVWGRDREQRFQDRTPVRYRIEVALDPAKWQVIATSEDRRPFDPGRPTASIVPEGLPATAKKQAEALLRQRERLQAELTQMMGTQAVYAGTFTEPGPTHLLLRGDPVRKGEEIAPGGLSVVSPKFQMDRKTPEKERRLALARWLGNPDNPLAARVMVNRVWHYHFGQGIVSTPSDFGANGDRPAHPELLDWLAGAFVKNGWKLKPLHRLIMLSNAYRQSGQKNDKGMSIDAQNRLLWRMTPRRLEAEAIRDSILSASGKLDLRMGGEGYNLWEKNTNYVTVFKPKATLGPEEFRRMIYQFKPRSQQDPVFGVFDCPDAALARPRRTVSTTVLQALNLLNSQLVITQAEFFAARVQKEAGSDHAEQARRAFLLALGRTPSATEEKAAVALIAKQGLATLCRALYNANEFLYVD